MNNKFQTISILLLLTTFGSGVATAAPTQRPNGNYYEVISSFEILWDDAETAADGSMFNPGTGNITGHLATSTSAVENAYIFSLLPTTQQYWLGGFQALPCVPAPGCGWTWVAGDGAISTPQFPIPGKYSNWDAGEPNDFGGESEDWLTIGFNNSPTWNDSITGFLVIGGYVVEYDVNPVAVADPGNMAKSGELITIDVLANDPVFPNDPLGQVVAAINIATPPANGTAVPVIVGCGAIPFCVTYQSNPGFGGPDTFTYTITDVEGDVSDEVLVSVDVDGSIAVTPGGPNRIIFGGLANGAPLKASGEFANDTTESSVRCCSVRDPRVGLGNTNKEGPTAFLWVPFDIGAAMSDPVLSDCPVDFPKPNPGELIVARHFGVHTEDPNSTIPAEYRFGVCLVDTGDVWDGPVHLDVTAEGIPGIGTGGDPDDDGYPVECKLAQGVEKQPLTIGLTVLPPEYTAPDMRAVTVECDPRGVAKWSRWYFIPNAQHLTGKETSKTYVGRMSSVLKDLIEAMRVVVEFEGPAASDSLLSEVKSDVLDAEELFKAKKATAMDAQAALDILDWATITALTPAPGSPDYPGNSSFPNPKGELVSHLMALRYAVCSELAYPDLLGECTVDQLVLEKLPGLLVD